MRELQTTSARAVQVYARLRTRLADDLGNDPGPQSRALFDEVLARATYDFSLLVTHPTDEASLERLVRRSPVSLLTTKYSPLSSIILYGILPPQIKNA